MIFEERLRLAAMEADAIRMNSLSDNQVNWEFSPRFQRKMKRLIKKVDRPVQFTLHRVASIILTVLLSATVWLCIDTNARTAFFAWVRETWEIGYHYFSVGESPSEGKGGTYRLGWLPEGYTEQTAHAHSSATIIVYADSTGRQIKLLYSIGAESTDLYVQSENSKMTSVSIGNITADLYIGNTPSISNTLVWSNDQTLFVLDAFLPPANLIKMAESIVD